MRMREEHYSLFVVIAAVLLSAGVSGATLAASTTDTVSGPATAGQVNTVIAVDIQLSPCVASGPINRCIHFSFFEDCVSGPEQKEQVISFTDGGAVGVPISLRPGAYQCATARDPLHTLRSVSEVSFDGSDYIARFVGDPDDDGDWLIGGNLDFFYLNGNPNIIDILDFGTLMYEVSLGAVYPDGDTTCDTEHPHGDLSGDGWVDALDYAFVAENFLAESKAGCCTDRYAARSEEPTLDITTERLGDLGMGELAVADLNGDEHVNMTDMQAYVMGDIPVATRGKGTDPAPPQGAPRSSSSFPWSPCQLDPLAHDGPVDLVWSPSLEAVAAEETFEMAIEAAPNDGFEHSLSTIELVITWDPEVLQLIGKQDPCEENPEECNRCTYDAECEPGVECYCPGGQPCVDPIGVCANGMYEWWVSSFPNGSSTDPDGLNDTWDDGDALYLAQVPLSLPPAPVLPGQPLSITTFTFLAQTATAPDSTELHVTSVAGSTPTYTRASGEMPGHLLTGSLGTGEVSVSCTTPEHCDDANLCTNDVCASGGICMNLPNYSVWAECCDPSTGDTVPIDDGDPCTADTCNPETGQVTHEQMPPGAACVDGEVCTVNDQCDAEGTCAGVDITTIPCSDEDDCFGFECNEPSGFCVCLPLINPPLTAPTPHDVRKNRYISFCPNNMGLVAFQVTISSCDLSPESEGITAWVGLADEEGISRLADAPVFGEDWPDVIHVGDCEILPRAEYEIRATFDAVVFSESLEVKTIPQPNPKEWGDMVGQFVDGAWLPPDGNVNMDDVLAVVQKFLQSPVAPHLTRVDLDGQVPNAIINFTDILQAVLAFKGNEYPFVVPAGCP